MGLLKKIGLDGFNIVQGICLYVVSRGITETLARRESERGRGTLRWLTADETSVLQALANTVVPSDEDTPGMEDVGVFGPPAVAALDTMIATSADKQHAYSRGLLSFDVWALKVCGRKFAELSKEDQIQLFRAAEHTYEDWTADGSAMRKALTRLRATIKASNGSFFAAMLYPLIRDDCFQVFYTSRVSWVWLDYDGPPMDKGYTSLVERREGA